MSVIVHFAMFPVGEHESLSPYVTQVVNSLRAKGVEYELGPMGTTFEVDSMRTAGEVLAFVHESLEAVANRIYCTATFDYRAGDERRASKKVDSVKKLVEFDGNDVR